MSRAKDVLNEKGWDVDGKAETFSLPIKHRKTVLSALRLLDAIESGELYNPKTCSAKYEKGWRSCLERLKQIAGEK